MTPRERFANSANREDALGRRIILKPYAKDRARLLKRRPGPERPWREELGLKPAATGFRGNDAGRRRFPGLRSPEKRYNKAVAEEYRIAERLAEAMGMKLVRYSEQDSVRLFAPGHMQPVRVWNGPGAGEEALRSRNGLLNAPANAPCPLGLDENSSNEEVDLVLSAMGF